MSDKISIACKSMPSVSPCSDLPCFPLYQPSLSVIYRWYSIPVPRLVSLCSLRAAYRYNAPPEIRSKYPLLQTLAMLSSPLPGLHCSRLYRGSEGVGSCSGCSPVRVCVLKIIFTQRSGQHTYLLLLAPIYILVGCKVWKGQGQIFDYKRDRRF